MVLQVGIEWVFVLPVNVDFLEHRESYAECVCEPTDGRGVFVLLFPELVAGECQYCEALILISVLEFDKLLVILVAGSSLGCHIHY